VLDQELESMNRDVASRIVKAAVSLNNNLGEIDLAISAIEDEAEKRRFVQALGQIFKTISLDLLKPVVAQYPSLEPYRGEESQT
jgi:hypothetical protein